MHVYAYGLIATIAFSILSGCSFSKMFKGKEYSQIEKKAPGWIDGAAINFPSEKYFVGVGVSNTCCSSAEKLSASKDAARAEIARIFRVKIESISEETLSSTLTGRGKYSSPEIRDNYSSFIRSSSEMLLEGVEIKDSFKSKRGEMFTLAVLEKEKALKLFQDKIRKKIYEIKKIANEASHAIGEKKPFLCIRLNRKALLSALEIELLNAQIVVAGGEALSLAPEYSSSFIKIKIDRLFSGVSISIDGKDDTVGSYILEELTAMGLRVKRGSDSADFLIKYEYSLHDDGKLLLSDDYVSYKARSDLALEFFKRGNKKVIGKVNLEARGVGKTEELAKRHSVNKLANVIREELAGAIFKFL